MDDLFLFIDSCHTDVLLIVEVVLVGHFCLIDELFIIVALVALLIGLGLVSALRVAYWAVSSYLGFLKAKFFLLRPLLASCVRMMSTCSPQPPLSLRGGKSEGICNFLH